MPASANGVVERSAVAASRAMSPDVGAPNLAAVRAWWWRHPEVPTAVIVVAAWIGLGVDHWSDHATVEAWRFSPYTWAAMSVAMMVPGIVPMQRWVAFNSLWRRRHRAAAVFTGVYVVAWVGFGLALFVLVTTVELLTQRQFAPERWWVAVVLLLAAGWHVVPVRKRALRRCHLRRPLVARGWRSDLAAARYGLHVAGACVTACAGVMVAMFVGAHDFHLMVPLTAIVLIERFQFRPNERIAALAIVATAAVSLVG